MEILWLREYMFSNKLFRNAFLISIVIHGIILVQRPNFNLIPKNNKTENLEISYVENPVQDKALKYYKKSAGDIKAPFLKPAKKIAVDKTAAFPSIESRQMIKENKQGVFREHLFVKPVLSGPDTLLITKKISFSAVNTQALENPNYLNYYQIVREKIRRAAYQNFTMTDTGEVYLSFIISVSGDIKDARIMGEKSTGNIRLQDVVLKSLRDASPFPKFPRELDYPDLTFNVIVSFKVE